MTYLGNTPTTQSFIEGTDYFNGDGSTTAFTLSRSVVSVNDIQATINNVVQQPNTAYTVSGTTITFTSAPSAGTANIYVRYLSTTTQSITPSQNTVSYSTLNSDNQSKLGISFKNRIINGAMVIDQRNAGASIAGTSGLYPLDRFLYAATQSSKGALQQNQGSVTLPAGFTNYLGFTTASSSYSVLTGDTFYIAQRIEGYNVADLGWGTANAKTVTLSFQVYSSLTGTFGGSLFNSTGDRSYPFSYTVSSANTWNQISVAITGDTTGTWLKTNGIGIQVGFGLGAGATYSGTANTWASTLYTQPTGTVSVVGTANATFYITGVQFEVGTQATTFDYRDYGRELILCQRYYFVATGNKSNTNYPALGSGNIQSAVNARICVTYPIYMRTIPTASISGTIVISCDTDRSSTALGSVYNGTGTSMLGFVISSGTAGNGATAYAQGTNNYVDFSAEL